MKKTYYIDYTDGLNKPSFKIPFDGVNTSTSLVLYGQGRKEYAEGLWNNLLHLLENFSNDSSPVNPTEGQLWYDTYNNTLKVYKKVNKSPTVVEIATPTNTNQSIESEYIWVELSDEDYINNTYGYGGINGIIWKMTEVLLMGKDNPLYAALLNYYVPYIGAELSGMLYLDNDTYQQYNNPPELYEAFSEGYLHAYLNNFAKTYKPEEGYFDIFGNSSRVDDTVGIYVPLNLENEKTISGGSLEFQNNVICSNSVVVPNPSSDNELVNRSYFDNLLTPSNIILNIKSTNTFKKIVSDAVALELQKPENITKIITPIPAVLSSYCVSNSMPLSGDNTIPVEVMSQKITPKTISSKILINISLVLANGSKTGQAVGGLYKDGLSLVEKFTIVEENDNDAMSSFYTYVDSATNTNETTYSIKVNGTKSGTDIWFLNQSANKNNFATSTMTLLEFNQVSQPSLTWLVMNEFNEIIINNDEFSGRIKIQCVNCTINNNFNFILNTSNIFTIVPIGNSSVVSNVVAIKQYNTDTEIVFDISGKIVPSEGYVVCTFTINSNIFVLPTGYTSILNIFKHIGIQCIDTTTTTTIKATTTTTGKPTTTTTLKPTTTTTLKPTTTTTLKPTTTTTLKPTTTTTEKPTTTTSTTIPTLKIGDALNGGFYIGDITDGGVKYKLILSPKSTELNFQYIVNKGSSVGNRTNNTPSRTDGPGNTAILSKNITDGFSAAWYCSNLSINGYSDWYLPAEKELIVMSVNRKALIAGPNVKEWLTVFYGGTGSYTGYSGGFYWSSTDDGAVLTALKVQCIQFQSNSVAETKETVCHVRAIRREPY